jgi:hypothetical protein
MCMWKVQMLQPMCARAGQAGRDATSLVSVDAKDSCICVRTDQTWHGTCRVGVSVSLDTRIGGRRPQGQMVRAGARSHCAHLRAL